MRKRDILWKLLLLAILSPLIIKWFSFMTVYFIVAVLLAYNFPDSLFNKKNFKISIGVCSVIIILAVYLFV